METYHIDGLTITEHLLDMATRGNRPFVESLNPGVEHILGIRIPELRRLAARIARGDWEHYLDSAGNFYMEERMLHGIVLGCIKPDARVEDYLQRVTVFVRGINSWSVCDTFKFAGGKRFIESHKERIFAYLQDWLSAEGEYERRFGIVMLMRYFIDEGHVSRLFSAFREVDTGEPCPTSACTPLSGTYYVKMALAWALSECYVKFPDETVTFLQTAPFDDFTYHKALQKITESFRVSPEQKAFIRSMRRKR